MSKTQRMILGRIVLAAVLFAAAQAVKSRAGVYSVLLYAVPYLVVGYDVLIPAVKHIFQGRFLDEVFLMSIATVGAFAIGKYEEGVAVMLFYQVGELFADLAVDNSRKSIAAAMDIRPDKAVVLKDGAPQEMMPEQVQVGDVLLIKPGERIPLDGIITKGSTGVDTAALTGESLPVDKTVGDEVSGGTINLTGVIEVRASRPYSESTVEKILKTAESAWEKKAKAERFITRFAKWYTPCVVAGAVLLCVVPTLMFGQEWRVWVERALIFLVVSCPCALVVSVPLTFFGGMGKAAREGILMKGANHLEVLSRADAFAFDKTGTISKGAFAVTEILPAKGVSKEELLSAAMALEQGSNHPLAKSVTAACAHLKKVPQAQNVTEKAGFGLTGEIDGIMYSVGNGKWMKELSVDYEEEESPGTALYVAKEKEFLGSILIEDQVKDNARTALAQLKSLGVKKTVMLTGDRLATALSVQKQVGLDDVKSQLLPHEKVTAVEDLLNEGYRVAFVGDGINDAPVLARADVGIAMGGMGSDAAIETADIVLMNDNLHKLSGGVKTARQTMRIVKQNIVLALGMKFIILLLSVFGYGNLWIAVFGDVGVTIIAVLNAMRILLPNGKEAVDNPAVL